MRISRDPTQGCSRPYRPSARTVAGLEDAIPLGLPPPGARCSLAQFLSRARGAVAALLLAASLCLSLAAAEKPHTHEQLLAAWLFLLAQNTEWPKEAFSDDSAPFVVGILGSDPFEVDNEVASGIIKPEPGETPMEAILKRLGNNGEVEIAAGGSKARRHLVVRRFTRTEDQLNSCHLVYISSSEKQRLSEPLGMLEKSSVLTVSEMSDFIDHKGIIDFVWKTTPDRKLLPPRLEINLAVARRNHLKLSDKLDPLTDRKLSKG